MNSTGITVVYRWTAHLGKFDELKAIYEDVFRDGAALGFHLGGTAAHHFPKLAEIAVPGPFFFCGEVPAELKQAAEAINMGAEFGTHVFGFARTP